MSTENTDVDLQNNEPSYTPVEQRALEQGWKPKDQFEGDEADFIDAAEFVRRGELFAKIDKQNKEIKVVREALDALKQHHSKVKEVEYQRALKALKAQRDAALVDGDSAKFLELEEQMETVKAEKAVLDQENRQVVTEPQVPPQLENWMQKNSWYQSNKAMTALADRIGAECRSKGYTLDQALREIDAEVRKEFPERFTVRKPVGPDSSSRANGSSSKGKDYKLSDTERAIMHKFVKSGVMSEADYIKELQRLEGN